MTQLPAAERNHISSNHMAPEQALFVGVIEQALQDLKRFNDPTISDPAWAFLTDVSGSWAISRRDICEAIGVHPDRLRLDVLKERTSPADLRDAQRAKGRARRAVS